MCGSGGTCALPRGGGRYVRQTWLDDASLASRRNTRGTPPPITSACETRPTQKLARLCLLHEYLWVTPQHIQSVRRVLLIVRVAIFRIQAVNTAVQLKQRRSSRSLLLHTAYFLAFTAYFLGSPCYLEPTVCAGLAPLRRWLAPESAGQCMLVPTFNYCCLLYNQCKGHSLKSYELVIMRCSLH